jgi:hypothetical protein
MIIIKLYIFSTYDIQVMKSFFDREKNILDFQF